jgi:hypothetical protein
MVALMSTEADIARNSSAWAVTESGEIASLWLTEEAAVKIMAHHRLRSRGKWDVERVTLVRRASTVMATEGKTND